MAQISADDWLDTLYGLGYLHGLDRGTQLLFARSVASGRGTEDISTSPDLAETDRFFRRIALYQNLDEEVSGLDSKLREELAAYCAGVNAGIEGGGRTWPMWATGYSVSPWDEKSVLLVGKLLSFGGLAVGQLQSERLLVELIHAGANEEGLKELFAPRLDGVDFNLIRQVKLSSQLSDEALELITDLPRLAGSNAWAVSGKRSASGNPLLASDPHLEINRLPAIWYEVALKWKDQYLMGATLPGCPIFAVARTRHLAWGVTYMKGDTVDFFVEDCRRGGATGWQYRRGETWHDFRLRTETIQSKGKDEEVLRIYENNQGVLESDPEQSGPGLYLSIIWSGMFPENGQAIGSWLDVAQSGSTAEAMDKAKLCNQPSLVWVMADREGHIGLQACGRFPVRGGGFNGLTPIPAWEPENHWQGWVPQDDLPRIYDPPEGFVASANEEIHLPDRPMLITQPLPDYRKRRIVERLKVLPSATINDMQSLQYDFVSLQARDLLKILMPHMPDGEIKQRLIRWDCQYMPDSKEAALFLQLYRNVMVEVFGHEQGIGWRRMIYLITRVGYSSMVLACADRLLAREKSVWWQRRDKSKLIRRAVARLEGAAESTWSEVNNFHFTDRFFGKHQVGRMLGYNTRQYPMPGNHATPFQGHVLQTATRESTFAPSYHFVTDLGTDEAWTNLPGGPSENRFSKWYKNGIAGWFTGEYQRLAADAD